GGEVRGGGMNSGDFSISANSTMQYIDSFTSGDYELIDGSLLSNKHADTNACVIETNLAEENDLTIGSTFTVYTTVDDETITQELEVVGIYEIITDTNTQGMGMMGINSVNTIYTDLSIGQVLTNDDSSISSATYYLDDPENMDAFIADAESNTDIDFETYTLNANDQLYQQNISSLENTESFATMFLIVVVAAGSIILGLILILTIRNRFHEIGIFLSLGQSKLKVIGQQLIEIGIIACVAFLISLGTGKMVSNVVSGMLVNSQDSNTMQMDMGENMPGGGFGGDTSSDSSESSQSGGGPSFNDAFSSPVDEELDVSLTVNTVVELGVITLAICFVSTMLPSIYVLRLSPREILMKKEG
ncbi:MAG: ABC transporter permease, partial [Coprobacillaceae bacterium]